MPRAKKQATTKNMKLLKSSTCFVSSRPAAGLSLAVEELNHIQACHKVLTGATRDVGRAEQQTMLVESLLVLEFAIWLVLPTVAKRADHVETFLTEKVPQKVADGSALNTP
jgi:hypothetical protein